MDFKGNYPGKLSPIIFKSREQKLSLSMLTINRILKGFPLRHSVLLYEGRVLLSAYCTGSKLHEPGCVLSYCDDCKSLVPGCVS